MEIMLEKQPQKYLASVDGPTRAKLERAIEKLRDLEGDIVRLSGKKDLFRCKIAHYRIIFSVRDGKLIVIEAIDTRTNIKYRRYRA